MFKHSLVTILLLCFSNFGMAQLVVNDPQTNATLMKQIAQSVKTVEQTTKTVSLLKETKEMYDNINSAFQTLDYISEMSKTTTQILENSGSFLQELQGTKMFSNKEMSTISLRFSKSMASSNTIMKVANDLLKGGIFKMNDAERLTLLKQSKQELNEALVDTRIAREKYLRIAERRSLKQGFSQSKMD